MENINTLHAHICTECLKNGVRTVWIHGDCKAGQLDAHICPKCGSTEWKKALVPVTQLPKPCPNRNRQQPQIQDTTVNVMPLQDVVTVVLWLSFTVVAVYLFSQNAPVIVGWMREKLTKTVKISKELKK